MKREIIKCIFDSVASVGRSGVIFDLKGKVEHMGVKIESVIMYKSSENLVMDPFADKYKDYDGPCMLILTGTNDFNPYSMDMTYLGRK